MDAQHALFPRTLPGTLLRQIGLVSLISALEFCQLDLGRSKRLIDLRANLQASINSLVITLKKGQPRLSAGPFPALTGRAQGSGVNSSQNAQW
jgi:hypothetical protein